MLTLKMHPPWMLATLLIITGCSSPDEQAIQNDRRHTELLAGQSAAVVQVSGQLATGAKELVSRDAAARQELITAQNQSQVLLHEERVSIDRQREALDGERRMLADQRQRDPILAATLQGAVELVACLSPLLLVAYALRQLGRSNRATAQLAEFLLNELTSSQPKLLAPSSEHARRLS
jgi:hypothetical protein